MNLVTDGQNVLACDTLVVSFLEGMSESQLDESDGLIQTFLLYTFMSFQLYYLLQPPWGNQLLLLGFGQILTYTALSASFLERLLVFWSRVSLRIITGSIHIDVWNTASSMLLNHPWLKGDKNWFCQSALLGREMGKRFQFLWGRFQSHSAVVTSMCLCIGFSCNLALYKPEGFIFTNHLTVKRILFHALL